MKVVQGDLLKLGLEGAFDVIVHGCNCQCAMGAGIAKSIREVFPEAYEADRKTVRGDRAKLGTFTFAEVTRGDRALVVVNAYTQFHWKGPEGTVDYDAVKRAMDAVKQRFAGKRLGYPRLGAGLARGDWGRLSALIDAALEGEDHTLVEFVPG